MTEFKKRRAAAEAKFAHDEALRFKATARRNKLLGLWAARKLGKSDAEAEAYARAVVVADFEQPGDDDVVRKVINDLHAAGLSTDESEPRRVMKRLMYRASNEIKAGI